MQKKVYAEIDSLNKEQCLKALGLIFSENGLREMLTYYTVGGMSDENSAENKAECKAYLANIKLAKKLAK